MGRPCLGRLEREPQSSVMSVDKHSEPAENFQVWEALDPHRMIIRRVGDETPAQDGWTKRAAISDSKDLEPLWGETWESREMWESPDMKPPTTPATPLYVFETLAPHHMTILSWENNPPPGYNPNAVCSTLKVLREFPGYGHPRDTSHGYSEVSGFTVSMHHDPARSMIMGPAFSIAYGSDGRPSTPPDGNVDGWQQEFNFWTLGGKRHPYI